MERDQFPFKGEGSDEENRLAGHPNSLFSETDTHRCTQQAIHALEKIRARFAGEECPANDLFHRQINELMQEIELESPETLTWGH